MSIVIDRGHTIYTQLSSEPRCISWPTKIKTPRKDDERSKDRVNEGEWHNEPENDHMGGDEREQEDQGHQRIYQELKQMVYFQD